MKSLLSGGETYAVIAALLWGINYPYVKIVLQSLPESQFMVLRFIASVLLLAAYLIARGEGLAVERRHWSRVLILGLAGVGLYNILWTLGIHRTTAANAALLISTSPIITAIYSAATRQEKVALATWLGAALAFAGVYLIISHTPGGQFSLSSTLFTGNLLVLAGSFLFALYGVLAKPLLDCYSPVKLTTLAMLGGLPVIAGYHLWQGGGVALATIAPATWLGMAFIVVFGTIIAFAFWYKGIKEATPVRATLFHFIVPVTSMVLGAAFLGEPVGAGQLIGAGLVLAGLVIVKLKPEGIAWPGPNTNITSPYGPRQDKLRPRPERRHL